MRRIVIWAKNKKEFAELVAAPAIERPLNQYWMRFVPPQMVAIGEDIALILDKTDLLIRREREEVTRPVRLTYVYKSERKIKFFLMNG